MKRITVIFVLGLLTQIPLFAQGVVNFDINFGGNPSPHTSGNPESGATLTDGNFYAILYLGDANPTSGSIVEDLGGGSSSTVFQFASLVYATYSGGGPGFDYEGSWQLTDTQIQNLVAGQWHAEVTYGLTTYTGRITVVPEPSSVALLFGGLVFLSAVLRHRRVPPDKLPEPAPVGDGSSLTTVGVHAAGRRWLSFLR